MNATTQRKPRQRSKPARFVRLLVSLNEQGENGLIRLTVGKQSDEYLTSKVPSDFGTAFRLVKVGGEEESTYDVLLDGDGGQCGCKGFSRWNHCKHHDGLKALRKAGKL
jgi:hypothetical protein